MTRMFTSSWLEAEGAEGIQDTAEAPADLRRLRKPRPRNGVRTGMPEPTSHPSPEKLWSKAVPTGVPGRLGQWPLTRSVLAVLFLAAVVMVHNVYTIFGLEKIPDPYRGGPQTLDSLAA